DQRVEEARRDVAAVKHAEALALVAVHLHRRIDVLRQRHLHDLTLERLPVRRRAVHLVVGLADVGELLARARRHGLVEVVVVDAAAAVLALLQHRKHHRAEVVLGTGDVEHQWSVAASFSAAYWITPSCCKSLFPSMITLPFGSFGIWRISFFCSASMSCRLT